MKNLRTLILSHNRIRELPVHWFESEGEQCIFFQIKKILVFFLVIEDYEPSVVLPSLFELFLDNNKLVAFHPKFSQVFKNLRLLALNNNSLLKFPPSIENMSCLLSLELVTPPIPVP